MRFVFPIAGLEIPPSGPEPPCEDSGDADWIHARHNTRVRHVGLVFLSRAGQAIVCPKVRAIV